MKEIKRLDKDEFYVFCPRKDKPNARHKSFESARDEAMRLAKLHPGFDFYVLKIIGKCTLPVSPSVVSEWHEEIPHQVLPDSAATEVVLPKTWGHVNGKPF